MRTDRKIAEPKPIKPEPETETPEPEVVPDWVNILLIRRLQTPAQPLIQPPPARGAAFD